MIGLWSTPSAIDATNTCEKCMDRLTNFILADAVETGKAVGSAIAGDGTKARRGNDSHGGDELVRKEEGKDDTDFDERLSGQKPGAQQRHLGVVMIPGKHLVSVQRLGGNGGPK